MSRKIKIFQVKCWLIFSIASLGCASMKGDTNDAIVFEKLPAKVGSIRWENNQRLIKERQESYRKYVPLPDAFGQQVPRAEGASLLRDQSSGRNAAKSPPRAPGIFQKTFFWGVVFAVGGYFILWKFFPGRLAEFNQRFNPWHTAPVLLTVATEKVRAEEKPLDEFLATFRVGSSRAGTAVPPAKPGQVEEFYSQAAELLTRQRLLLQDIVREPGALIRQKLLSRLRVELEILQGVADFPEALSIWQAASALAGLLGQLTEKIGNVTPSSLRTVAGGLELIEDFLSAKLKPQLLADRPLQFLVVDDDWISRKALSLALGKVFSEPDLVPDGAAALGKLAKKTYDVIFLDVQMPGMDGFELCVKLRETALNARTPVVFVSVHSDFNARARSTLSGGNDLMAKPFLTFELTVKAFTYAMQGRLHGHAEPLREPGRDLLYPLLRTFAEPERPMTKVELAPRDAAALATEEMTDAFLSRVKNHLELLQALGRNLPLAADEVARQGLLVDGFLRINSLVANTGGEMRHPAYQLLVALEGLFRKLLESAKNSSPSTLITIASAVDLLSDLCALELNRAIQPPVNLLVVDDDLVARRVLVGALQKTFPRPESVESGEAALALAAEKTYDVIFLDVIMPGMDGFETCLKIRGTIPNRTTPVVFVTSQNDAHAHEQMVRNGGNDILGKPFLTSEITVKALTFALRGRLQRLKP